MPQAPAESFPLIAAIDLGSNSFHMVLAKADNHEIRILERLGDKVQLAAGLDDERQLSEEAMQRGLDCLRRFAQFTNSLPEGAVRIVGTNALREARNRAVFIRRAEEILGHQVEVISGREEARLIYLGVSHSIADTPGKRLVADIGGGSTEFIIGQRFEPLLRESLQMGCVSFTQRYFKDGKITPARYAQAYTAARLELMGIEQGLRRLGWEDAVGASGTIKAIGLATKAAGLGNGEVTAEGLAWLKRKLFKLGEVEKIDLDGIKPDRRGIFPAGLAILEAIFDACDIQRMSHSEGALREGVLETDSQDPVSQLRALAEGYGEWAERNPALFRLLSEGLNQPKAEDGTLHRYTLSMRELFLRKLTEMRDLGILAKDTDLNDLLLVLHALVKGANTLFTTRSFDPWLHGDSRSSRLLTRIVFDEFINGILRSHAPVSEHAD